MLEASVVRIRLKEPAWTGRSVFEQRSKSHVDQLEAVHNTLTCDTHVRNHLCRQICQYLWGPPFP